MDATTGTGGRNYSGTVDIYLTGSAAGMAFSSCSCKAIRVRSGCTGANTGAWGTHVYQRMRSATRAGGHQFTVDRNGTARSEGVVRIGYQTWRCGIKLRLAGDCRKNRFVLSTLNRQIIECADGLVGRSICSSRIRMIARIESPGMAIDPRERGLRGDIVYTRGGRSRAIVGRDLIWRNVGKREP
jgi:hypothetical protein